MNWKTAMYLDLIAAQARRAEHDHIVRTLEDLIAGARGTDLEAFWRRCLTTYEREAWDL